MMYSAWTIAAMVFLFRRSAFRMVCLPLMLIRE